jgi:CheY-like chemotaxis protein
VENARSKNSLVYEGRKTFATSIIYTLESLGVPNKLVRDKDELMRELQSNRYQFVFIAWPVAGEILAVLKKSASAITVAAMSEYGKKIPLGCRELYMPTQPIIVANILNGKSTGFGFQDIEFLNIRFTAPEARILVVDDIASNIDVVRGLLAPYKITVDKADSGVESIEMVKMHKYDLVLMDHMMPGMDGIEATVEIRAWEESQNIKKVPIVALTANAITGMKEMFLGHGFNDYLSKPIEIVKLDEIISRWIPAEKRIKAGAGIKREALSGNTGIVIPGVDTLKGIAMTGGTETGYRKVLVQFYKDVVERLPVFAALPGETEIALFTIQAHAIKSAAATIGAAEVSKEAASLETAGRAKDVAAIQETLPAFREHLTQLTEELAKALKEGEERIGKDEVKNVFHSLPIARAALLSLKEALKAKHMKEIDRLLEEIEQLPLDTRTREQINAVSDKVLMGEYQGAVTMIDEMIALP